LRELRHFCRAVFATQTKRSSVRQRQEIRVRPLHHAQAVFDQAQIADHLRVEQ
jgi:hypothetical protein